MLPNIKRDTPLLPIKRDKLLREGINGVFVDALARRRALVECTMQAPSVEH